MGGQDHTIVALPYCACKHTRARHPATYAMAINQARYIENKPLSLSPSVSARKSAHILPFTLSRSICKHAQACITHILLSTMVQTAMHACA